MELKIFECNPFSENTYVIWSSQSKQAAIVDPGMIDEYEVDVVRDFIDSKGLKLEYVLLTHIHIDHYFGVEALKRLYGGDLPVLAHKGDASLGLISQQQADMFHLPIRLKPLEPTRFIGNGTELELGGEKIEVIETPGHSLGGLCYFVPESGFMLSGDTLFRGSIGRTDLPGGNFNAIINSIADKLLVLPTATVVYPGHGPSTTIAIEAVSNPYIQ